MHGRNSVIGKKAFWQGLFRAYRLGEQHGVYACSSLQVTLTIMTTLALKSGAMPSRAWQSHCCDSACRCRAAAFQGWAAATQWRKEKKRAVLCCLRRWESSIKAKAVHGWLARAQMQQAAR